MNKVITSKEKHIKIPNGMCAQVKITKDRIEWIFKTEKQADDAFMFFVYADCDYVRRA